jgi:DNA mismatch endonuclease (patch repair protein)
MRFDSALEQRVYDLLSSNGINVTRGTRKMLGSPDFIWEPCSVAIFVHGCYWHRHSLCSVGKAHPTRNVKYWDSTFARIVQRDERSRRALRRQGWTVAILWECRFVLEERAVIDAMFRVQNHTQLTSKGGTLIVV